MAATKKDIASIEKAFETLRNEMEIYPSDLDEGDETVTIIFPRDEIEIDLEDLLKYVPEINNLETTPQKVYSPTITQIPVTAHDYSLEIVVAEHRLELKKEGLYRIRLIDNPLLIGIASVKLDFYDKYWPPCSQYHAVEIVYADSQKRLSEKEEMSLVKSYLYEFSNICGIAIEFHQITEPLFDYDYEETPAKDHVVNNLPEYTEGMDLFRKALGSADDEIKFLYYYKIIEFYSPIAAKRVAYENVTRKLDGIRMRDVSNNDIKSIFSIADKFRAAQTDKELAQNLLTEAIDIVDAFADFPEFLKKKTTKQHGFKREDFTYDIKLDIQQAVTNTLGTVLYSTRNSIVHAKSNYVSDQNECPQTELANFNNFLKTITYNIIAWYNRLPKHLKVED
ncbi:hypothetical protein ACFQZX_00520 [Mucilaginibacter litoreus]|uniref:Apea-like HEPN domain-containing protein n=1 Tax=Mucilaginibacter litoreus TaxID=1048221 RepID=A0ABW3AMQ8_9SPHI